MDSGISGFSKGQTSRFTVFKQVHSPSTTGSKMGNDARSIGFKQGRDSRISELKKTDPQFFRSSEKVHPGISPKSSAQSSGKAN